eukprot:CAMPEP_0202472830 /NCGR_PEP_ID=MMETSP1360-20130828/89027_1 /ASSEMBLY_ACC=CAM_ASM_000848 /TAXON_ID=515479 /ORGANISM="Licmophora paradoxa, Strain CCMP2313" /LENGTH=208 /DNA_ID=CAMNT_0049099497 /DNA_START=52 /DNA_END=675 /DNA_ORIENTATION=+
MAMTKLFVQKRFVVVLILLLFLVYVVFLYRIHLALVDSWDGGSKYIGLERAYGTSKKHSHHNNRRVDGNFAFHLTMLQNNANCTDEQCILEHRAPSRIPAYFHGSNNAYFGYVFRDFATRVLPLHPLFWPASIVIVISQDAEQVLAKTDQYLEKNSRSYLSKKEEETLRREVGYTVGGSFLLRAITEKHRVYGVASENASNDRLLQTL